MISIRAKLHNLANTGGGVWELRALLTATVDHADGTTDTYVNGWRDYLNDGNVFFFPLPGSPAFADPNAPTEAEVSLDLSKLAAEWLAEFAANETKRENSAAPSPAFIKNQEIAVVSDSVPVDLSGALA